MSGAWGDDMLDFDRDDREPAREMMAEDSKLLPCPFCQSPRVADRYVRDGRQMFCINCGASVAPTYHGPNNDTLERARDAWNRRAAPVNAMSGEEPKTITCEACEGPVEYDLLVSDDLWAKIAPRQVDGWKGGGVLCPSCILDRSIVVASTPRPSELVAAMRKALKAISIFDGAAYELRNMAADALHDSLTTEGQAAGVEVRALEWEPYPNPKFAGPDVAIAHVDFRHFYQAQRDPNAPGFMVYLTPQFGTLWWESKGHDTIEAAKAAAQSDYDRRIRSALVTAAPTTPGKGG